MSEIEKLAKIWGGEALMPGRFLFSDHESLFGCAREINESKNVLVRIETGVFGGYLQIVRIDH